MFPLANPTKIRLLCSFQVDYKGSLMLSESNYEDTEAARLAQSKGQTR